MPSEGDLGNAVATSSATGDSTRPREQLSTGKGKKHLLTPSGDELKEAGAVQITDAEMAELPLASLTGEAVTGILAATAQRGPATAGLSAETLRRLRDTRALKDQERDSLANKELLATYLCALRGEGNVDPQLLQARKANAAGGAEGAQHQFVIRLRYQGCRPDLHLSREYLVGRMLIEQLGLSHYEIKVFSLPPGVPEADILLRSELAYRQFWEAARQDLETNPLSGLLDFQIQPLHRGDVRAMTVYLHSGEVPMANVACRLAREARLLYGPLERMDEFGIGTCEVRAVLGFHRDEAGRICHVPRYFFLGPDRATMQYAGQLQE
ncbi:UNVERIFIED_CONTAM: hypothetical protein K2H54_062676 [Gekko kuhli]